MDRYFYFRDVANEDADTDDGASVMVPVKNITGIGPGTAITELDIWFQSGICSLVLCNFEMESTAMPNNQK